MIKLNKDDILLFAGDSITHGGRLLSMDLNHIMGHGYQEIISAKLAAENIENMPRFVNKGVSGDRISHIYARWADILKQKPTIISLLAGINDTGAFPVLKPETIAKKYIYVLKGLLNDTFEYLPRVKFILCEPFYLPARNQDAPYENIPHPFCESYFKFGNTSVSEEEIKGTKESIALIQQGLREVAKEYSLIFVPFQDMFDSYAKKVPSSYLVWDNVHPTMVGHQLMADRWLEVVNKSF